MCLLFYGKNIMDFLANPVIAEAGLKPKQSDSSAAPLFTGLPCLPAKWGEPSFVQREQHVQRHCGMRTWCVLRQQGRWASLEHLWIVPGTRWSSWLAFCWSQRAGLEKDVMLAKTCLFLVSLDSSVFICWWSETTEILFSFFFFNREKWSPGFSLLLVV